MIGAHGGFFRHPYAVKAKVGEGTQKPIASGRRLHVGAAAIAILRCLLSSPAAAASVLGARVDRMAEAVSADESSDEIDRSYRPQVMDALGDEETADFAPTAPLEDVGAAWSDTEQRQLLRYRDRARDLGPTADRKLAKLIEVLKALLAEGRRPIVFCRFIPTANYLQKCLASLLKKVTVVAVTGEYDDEQRKERIAELVTSDPRILVATDCLSEGVNLQEHFDAVVHYDLPWNPNRLEQREGRVDRFGQPKASVKTVLALWLEQSGRSGRLGRAHTESARIRRDLGISVPVPVEAEQVIQTVVDNVLLRGRGRTVQLELALAMPDTSRLHEAWDEAAKREERSRGYFDQHGIKPDEVAREVEATDAVLGDTNAVRQFLADALQRFGGELTPRARAFGVKPLVVGLTVVAYGTSAPELAVSTKTALAGHRRSRSAS